MQAFAAPLAPGKLEVWEAWIAELNGPRKAGFDDMNTRLGLTAHHVWLQETPDGHHLVIVVLDGPGAQDFMGKVAASDHEFETWFQGVVTEVHGMDLTAPPPLPKQFL